MALAGLQWTFRGIELLFPVGISFYSIQVISYLVDVFNGKVEAEKNFGHFALYVSFFPQLLIGPIERYNHLKPQLLNPKPFVYQNFVDSLVRIGWGLFKKMVIADNLSLYVDQVYASTADYNSFSILTALFFYSFQIYCDFFGYSTIAIGTALIMGIKIMDNFSTPYLAKSINEFWQRWHISLSTWFRDYLYFPLGGNRVKKQRWAFNIFVVFTVSGLWHGANWTFVIWGALFGFLFVSENLINKHLKIKRSEKNFSIKHILLALKTFVLVTLLWVFFRSQSFDQAINIFSLIFENFNVEDSFNVDIKIWIFLLLFIITDLFLYNNRFDKWCSSKSIPIRWSVYFILIFMIVVFSGVENYQFIYFQF